MERLDYGPVILHLTERRVEHAEGEVELTRKEASVLAYLARRQDDWVSRRDLERDVWRMKPGVKSETVPVTMRRLRRKLPAAAEQVIVETARGRGWRLVRPPEARSRLPQPSTPLLERPVHQATVSALLERWQLLTLTGPAGIGKTRLALAVASSWPGEVFHLQASAHGTAAALRQALAMQLDVTERADVAEALAHRRRPLLVVDEAEICWEEVRSFVEPLAGVLVTSRRPLGLPTEAVFEVPPLDEEEGRRFFDRRVEASRWHRGLGSTERDRLLAAVDGLPLAIELALASPADVGDLVDALTRAAPDGLPQLDATLERSWRTLDAEQRSRLAALAQFSDVFTPRMAKSYLPGVDLLPFADRSWITWENGAWRMLRTTRGFILRACADAEASLVARHRHWLPTFLDGLHEAITTDKAAARRAFGPLIPDALLAFEADPVEHVALVVPLVVWFTYQGHRSRGRELVRRCLTSEEAPPVVYALAGLYGVETEGDPLERAGQTTDPDTRCIACTTRVARGDAVDEETVEAAAGRLGTRLRPFAAMAWITFLLHHRTGHRDPRLEALLRSCPPGGYYATALIPFVATARYFEEGHRSAIDTLATIEGARSGPWYQGRLTQMAIELIEEPAQAVAAGQERLVEARRVGDFEVANLYQGLLAVGWYRLGSPERARRQLRGLDAAVLKVQPETRRRVDLLEALLADGEPPEGFEHLVALGLRLDAGDPEVVADIAALPDADDFTAAWLHRHLEERAGLRPEAVGADAEAPRAERSSPDEPTDPGGVR
jgi:DNA-binding winged helix-turn-helix (wHTH) protein